MKKVLICIPTLASAGAERFVTELACCINKDEFDAKVVVTTKLDRKSAFYAKLIEHEISVIDASGKNYFQECMNLISLFHSEKPDIIHSNVGAALHVLLPQLLCFARVKHLFTAHSMGYRIFSGVKKKIMDFCFKRKIIIPVAICDTVKKSIVESYRIKDDEVEVVYNGVDTEQFSVCKKTNREVAFISVGTLYHIKNHELLIDAFSEVVKKYIDAKLVLVGDGELREKLQQQVESLGISNNVVFAGNQKNVQQFLRDSDIYCCSSKVEGLPLSVLEAMACGLPVVTTPAGGVVDIVINGVNGFVVAPNVAEYSEKMIELAGNSSIRYQMSVEARKLAERYSIDNCAREYEKLYNKYSKKH